MTPSEEQPIELDVSQEPTARLKLPWILLSVAAIIWLLTGIYVVPSDEVAVESLFGKAARTADGNLEVEDSGLHYQWPWPLGDVTRVRLFEPRTLTIGNFADVDAGEFLKTFSGSDRARFVSGDKNILQVELTVHYRLSRTNLDCWMFGDQDAEARLRSVVEATVSDVVLRSGVDFVHTLGHATIRRAIQTSLQSRVVKLELGVEIDDVSISGVNPPVRVKAEFIDVMNARADRETYVHRAKAYAEQQLASANATAQKLSNEAKSYEQKTVESAKAEADSFEAIVDQLATAGQSDPAGYATARRLALERRYIDMLSTVYRNVAGKVFLDSGEKFDITIHRKP
jgi:modulator of FtsH protease HflK